MTYIAQGHDAGAPQRPLRRHQNLADALAQNPSQH